MLLMKQEKQMHANSWRVKTCWLFSNVSRCAKVQSEIWSNTRAERNTWKYMDTNSCCPEHETDPWHWYCISELWTSVSPTWCFFHTLSCYSHLLLIYLLTTGIFQHGIPFPVFCCLQSQHVNIIRIRIIFFMFVNCCIYIYKLIAGDR